MLAAQQRAAAAVCGWVFVQVQLDEKRGEVDQRPLDFETSCSMQTFTMTVKTLAQHHPDWFILENVPGARRAALKESVPRHP